MRPKEKKMASVNQQSHGSLTASQYWFSSHCSEDYRSMQTRTGHISDNDCWKKKLKQISPSILMKVSNKSDFAGQLNAGLNHRLTNRPLIHCTSAVTHLLPLYNLFYVPKQMLELLFLEPNFLKLLILFPDIFSEQSLRVCSCM